MPSRQDMKTGWTSIKLGEYLTELSQRNTTSSNNGTPVLSVTNKPGFAVSEEFFDRKVFSKNLTNYKVISKGQFAYNPSRVNVGSIARLKEFDKGLLSPMYVVFETKDGLLREYLDYWISSQRFRNLVKAGTQGSVRDSLNFSALAEFPFTLPPVIEQRKIVYILSILDSLIEKTQAVIDQTYLVKRGLMQNLFTSGILGRHKKFKKTEIGNIPEKWDVILLRNFAEVITKGTTPTTYGHAYTKDGVLFLRIENINEDGEFILKDVKYISKETNNFLGRSQLKSQDILFSIAGALGRVAIVSNSLLPANINQAIALIRLKKNNINRDYLVYALQAETTRIQIYVMAAQLAQANLNLQQVGDLKIPLPGRNEQREIVEIITAVNHKLSTNAAFLGQVQSLKSALMQVLLTGEVRVKA